MRVFHLLVLVELAFVFELEIVLNADLSTVELIKVYFVSVLQDVYRSHKVNLVFVHT
jgi:hypothetical protein